MNHSIGALGALALACIATSASAQTAAESGWTSTVSATGVLRSEADIDGTAAKLRSGLGSFRASFTTPATPSVNAGVSVVADSFSYQFSGASDIRWGDVERFGVALPITQQTANGWVLLATPSLDVMRESGATTGDSLIWGGLLGATKAWAPDRQLGLGLQVMRRFDQNLVVPLIFVNWNLGSGWSIANPLPAGPTGPAGLELRYQLSPALTASVGATWRSFAFRLKDQPGQRDAVGVDQSVPVFAQLSYAITPAISVQAAAGMSVGGKLEVQNGAGDTLREHDLGNSALFGIHVRGRF